MVAIGHGLDLEFLEIARRGTTEASDVGDDQRAFFADQQRQPAAGSGVPSLSPRASSGGKCP